MKKIYHRKHPEYVKEVKNWSKYRCAYESGDEFVDKYLQRFSIREDWTDFYERKRVTYCPAHAKAAIQDIKNAIFQRMADIKRSGGAETWMKACDGVDHGVDLTGNSMTSFVGRILLPELLPLGKVGVYIDKPALEQGLTKDKVRGVHPYIYIYTCEQILNWRYDANGNLVMVILEDEMIRDDEIVKEYREMILENGIVTTNFYDKNGELIVTKELNMPRIPFVIAQISEPLMRDIADYQIALLNLASSDMAYALKANFPFYVEQYNPSQELTMRMREASQKYIDNDDGTIDSVTGTGTSEAASKAGEKEIKVGSATGRRYPMGANQPDFIHPSSEPLEVSMKKQEQLIQEIRQIVNLAVSNIAPQRASAESKKEDLKSLEAGLSYIGLELEYVELEIARIWNIYENTAKEPVVKYPANYSLRNDSDRRQEAEELSNLRDKLPSLTYQKEISKLIVETLLSTKVSKEVIKKVYSEIESAKIVTTDHDTLRKDVEAGLVSTETASLAAGYPKGESEKAENDHARRAARIMAAQTNGAARGVDDLGGDAKEEKKISQSRDMNPDNKKKVRGDE